MRKSPKTLVALVLVAVAVPAVAIGGGNGTGGSVNSFVELSIDKATTKSKQWRTIPNMPSGTASTNQPQAVTLSAEMKEGKAKIRLVPAGGGPAVPPGSVLFSSKAANSFSWALSLGTCDELYVFEWKKVGKEEVVASNMSRLNVFSGNCV